MLNSINRKHSKRISALTRRVAAIAAAAIAVSSVAASAVEFGEIQEVQPGDSVNATVSQPTLPLSEYPATLNSNISISYFTTDGNKCVNHNHCKTYSDAKQCIGFAIYVFDTYSHLSTPINSSWKVAQADRHRQLNSNGEYIPTSTSKEIFQNRLQSLPTGSYVRVRNSGGIDHAFIIVSTSSTGVTLYDANINSDCGVRLRTETYVQLATSWAYLLEIVYHNYPIKATTYNESYHKKVCSTSGCTGYVWERHTLSVNKAGKYACTGCGYISGTTPGVMSIEDEPANYEYGDEHDHTYAEEGYESDIDNTNAYGDNVSEDTENTKDASADEEHVPSVQDDLT